MRETTDDREFDSRFDAAFQPGFDDSFGIGFAEAVRSVETAPRTGPLEGAPAPRARPLVDRFVIALWVIGAGLLGLGLVGVTNAMVSFSSSYGPTPDYLIGVVFAQLAPWLVAIGLATLIGTLFLLAIRWEHRP
ncbi:hypothetical protein [Herbiconiux ginsengi]|uniref:Uncharacterized protein n=1 Tax=Herbiconiux ginsengi TaxID=381665 RepID=A0A1H3PLP4_9MICO|nr:hypothetical protein [Herbiconiux ginsengi]SDZ01805.1 hypothetical protein SAMN05216554_1955 [Herbiconiux ginsengi]